MQQVYYKSIYLVDVIIIIAVVIIVITLVIVSQEEFQSRNKYLQRQKKIYNFKITRGYPLCSRK